MIADQDSSRICLTVVGLVVLAMFLPASNGFASLPSRPHNACIIDKLPLFATVETPQTTSMLEDDDDEAELLLLEGDGEIIDYTPEEAEAKRQEWLIDLRHLARTSNRDDTATVKAQAIFDTMFETYVEQEDSIFFPDVQVYNLLLETHAYSKADDGAEQAEDILKKMQTAGADNPYVVKPNEESYLNVMDAWAMRKRPDKVQALIDQLQQEMDGDDSDIEASSDVYNKLIKAHGIAGDIEQAEKLFRSLLDEKDDELPPANHKSWVQIMKAYLSQGFASHVEDLFEEMSESEEFEPATEAHNVLIRAIGARDPHEAEAKLYEMMERFRKGEVLVKPNADTFRIVLLSYNSNRKQQHSPAVVAKLDQLLQIQDSFLTLHGNDDGDDDQEVWKPDERLYNIVIGIIARSQDQQKATRIRRMIERFQKATKPSPEALSRFYASQLKACAFTDGTAEEKLAVFPIALEVLSELRKETNGLELNDWNACMFLKACRNLMPKGSKRDEVVQLVFDDCCSRGIVSDFVVNELEKVLPGSMQLELLGGFIEDGVRIKKEWKRNVQS